jgi:DNA-binding FadR family transcriptional regulator
MKPIDKVERYTLSKLVVRNLKQYIIENRLATGEKLPAERELAQEMNVSRAILREALRSLESSGILEIRHGEGAYIAANSLNPLLEQLAFTTRMSGNDGKDLIDMRLLLERALIDEALDQGSSLPIAEMERWNESLAAQSPGDDIGQAVEADVQLHLALFRARGNHALLQLAELLLRLSAEAALERGSLKQLVVENSRYIGALRNGDARAAKLALGEPVGADHTLAE